MAYQNRLLRSSTTGYAIRSDLTGYGAPSVNVVDTSGAIVSDTLTGTQSVVHAAGVHARGIVTFSGIAMCTGCKNNTSPTGSWSAFGDPNGAYEVCRYETTNNLPIHLARVEVPGLYVEHYALANCVGSPDSILDKLSLKIVRTNTGFSVTLDIADAWIDDNGNPTGSHAKNLFFVFAGASGCVALGGSNSFTSCPASYVGVGGSIAKDGSATVEF